MALVIPATPNDLQLAVQALETQKADKDSPNLTGTPTADTAAPNVNSRRLATTEFVNNAFEYFELSSYSLPTNKVDVVTTTDTIESAFEKLQFQAGVKLMSKSVGSATTWIKVAEMKSGTVAPMWGLFHARFTGGGSAYTGHYFTDVKMSIAKSSGAQALRIMSVTEIVSKNTDITYFPPEYGYVLDGATFDIYLKVSKSTSGMMMHPILLDDMVVPQTFTTTTTEPVGIVYVVPVRYASLESPVFTGIPMADTAAVGTNTNQLATTAFVQAAIDALKAEIATKPIALLVGDTPATP